MPISFGFGKAQILPKGQSQATGIVTQNLVLHLDASNASSYPGSGTTWTDLSGANRNATLQSGMTYSSGEGQGSIVFTPTTYATSHDSKQIDYANQAWQELIT